MPDPYEPQPVGEPIEYWIDPEKKDSKGNPLIYMSEPPGAKGSANWSAGGLDLGIGGAKSYKHITRITYDNGEIFDFDDEGKGTYVDIDRDLQRKAEQLRKAEQPSSPYRFKDEGGNIYEYQPMAPNMQGPPQPPQKIFSEPSGIERARQQHYTNIGNIKDMLSKGEIEENEADRLIGMSKQYMESAMRGGTPWDIEKTNRGYDLQQQRLGLDQQELGFKQQKQKEDLSSGLISDRLRTGTSLAETLIGSILDSYRKTLSSTNPSYLNPFKMAKSYVDDMGYGEENAGLARAFLKGALGGQ